MKLRWIKRNSCCLLPVIFGILGTNSLASVQSRSGGSLGPSFQISHGNYIFQTGTIPYSLYPNLCHDPPRFHLSVSAAIIARRGESVTHTGGMFVPNSHLHGDGKKTRRLVEG